MEYLATEIVDKGPCINCARDLLTTLAALAAKHNEYLDYNT